jgi:1,2-diacylglycerol 3-beta-glucosyltransferase
MAFATIFFGLFFGLCGLILLLVLRRRPALPALMHLPRVSIFIAARNEEATIERCLQSLTQLNYPVEQLEILIGDDASTDNTRAVVARFIADKPQFRLIPVRHALGTARGKSNVLAQLSRVATTDYFLITDADMALAPDWVQTMVAAAPEGVGVVTGITGCKGSIGFSGLI